MDRQRDTLRLPTDEWNDLEAPNDFDASSKSKRRGTRGRGRRINYVKKAVFQPSVRVVPIGMNERMGESGRGRAETKIGRAGLVLVNRRAVGSMGSSPNVSDTCDAVELNGRAESVASENPWARRSQSHARHVATAQKPDTHKETLPACDVAETCTVNGKSDSVAKEPEQSVLDSVDSLADSAGHVDEMEQRLRDQMEAHVATAEHKCNELMISSAVSSETESSSKTEDSCKKADFSTTKVDTVPTTLAPSTDVAAADTAEAWGSRTKATGSEPTPEQPKSRWWKASLTGGSRRVDSALKPMPRNAALVSQKPEPKPDDGRARGKAVRNRRGQAPIPTVVPPLVLARATIRSMEQRPVPDTSRAHSQDLAAVDVPVSSAEHSSEPATGSTDPVCVEPIALELPSTEPAPSIKLDADPVKKRVSIDVPMQAESWRVPLSLAKTASIETLGKNGSAAQRQPSTNRTSRAPPQKQTERRERGRAATNSMAAMSTNWRVNRSTSTVDTALPSDISRPSTAFTSCAPWSDTESLPQNGPPVVERQRAHTQGLRPSQAYYGSIPDMASLLQISNAPLSSASRYPAANTGSRTQSSPPPLLPPSVLADILSDGEPARTVSLQTSVPSSSSSLASVAAAHGRTRRISSVIGAVPASKPDTLAFVSRGRSSSSLFHGANGADSVNMVRPLAQPDQGLFLWQPDPAQGSTSNHVQGAEPVWGMPSRALGRPLHADHAVFGMSQAPTFSAFSSGASMLWAEPVQTADSRVFYGPSVSQVRDNGQTGRAPRPIGTRSTPAANGVRSAQVQSSDYPGVQKPRSDYQNSHVPNLEYQSVPPWQAHYSPLQLPPVYGTMQAAVPDSYGAHVTGMPANSAPYMVPVSDPSMHLMVSSAHAGRPEHYPVLVDAFGGNGLYPNVPQYANGYIRPQSPMYQGVSAHVQPYAQYYSTPLHGALQPRMPLYMAEAQMGQPMHTGAHVPEHWASAPHVSYAQPVHTVGVESQETVQQVPEPVESTVVVPSVHGQNARRKQRDRPRNAKHERKQPSADDSSRRKAQTDHMQKKSDEKAPTARRTRANRKPGRKRSEPGDTMAK
ncbi:hypothetical protein GGF49_003893 [Coemansia sp. RSA 1853]|nr:hypothetical protein GGF49_003893 [Coemansia sp. RSA 1853]